MAGISRYETRVLGLTAAFFLLVGGWFLTQQNRTAPWQVTTLAQAEESTASAQTQWPDSLLEGEVIDLNSADEYDLGRLPGIGEKRARAIVAYRQVNGPFQTVAELERVEGIGPGILAGLEPYAAVNDGLE